MYTKRKIIQVERNTFHLGAFSKLYIILHVFFLHIFEASDKVKREDFCPMHGYIFEINFVAHNKRMTRVSDNK